MAKAKSIGAAIDNIIAKYSKQKAQIQKQWNKIVEIERKHIGEIVATFHGGSIIGNGRKVDGIGSGVSHRTLGGSIIGNGRKVDGIGSGVSHRTSGGSIIGNGRKSGKRTRMSDADMAKAVTKVTAALKGKELSKGELAKATKLPAGTVSSALNKLAVNKLAKSNGVRGTGGKWKLA